MPKFKAAAYIRLSYTDDRSSESNSVSNQRKLIENFVERNPDIEIISEKISAYIEDKATQFGADLQAETVVCDGVPMKIDLYGAASTYVRTQISSWIEKEIGIESGDVYWH